MNCLVSSNDWKWTPCVFAIFIGPSACSAHSNFETKFWPKSERMYVGRGPSVEHPGFVYVVNTTHLSSKYQDGQVPAWKFGNIRRKLMIGIQLANCKNDHTPLVVLPLESKLLTVYQVNHKMHGNVRAVGMCWLSAIIPVSLWHFGIYKPGCQSNLFFFQTQWKYWKILMFLRL